MTDLVELGEAEATNYALAFTKEAKKTKKKKYKRKTVIKSKHANSPLASSRRCINDCLRRLDLAETVCILEEQLIISSGMKPPDVYVAVPGDSVLKALFQSFHLLRRGENGRDSARNLRVLLEELIQVFVNRKDD